MTKLDFLYEQAAENMGEPALKSVIQKEIIHHDILRILSEAGFLNTITFAGGTCLRLIYGSSRYSEDLDFTAGPQSLKNRELQPMANVLSAGLSKKFELPVTVLDPKQGKEGNVDTWRVRIVTAPDKKGIPQQKINIDVALTSSRTCLAHTLINHYRIDLGTAGVIVNCQSEEEILADKLVAFAGRDKIKARDLWDTALLKQRCDIQEAWGYVGVKLKERGIPEDGFFYEYHKRILDMKEEPGIKQEFEHQMTRFLPLQVYRRTVLNDGFWASLVNTQSLLLSRGKELFLNSGREDQWKF